jgi:hypothetical protein
MGSSGIQNSGHDTEVRVILRGDCVNQSYPSYIYRYRNVIHTANYCSTLNIPVFYKIEVTFIKALKVLEKEIWKGGKCSSELPFLHTQILL